VIYKTILLINTHRVLKFMKSKLQIWSQAMNSEIDNLSNAQNQTDPQPTADSGNKFGLSRKSNVAIAAITGLAVVKDSPWAIGAVVVIALVAILTQTLLDWFDKDDSY